MYIMNKVVNYGNNTFRGVFMNSFTDNPINICPHCKYNLIVKYGSFKNRQRYKCKGCNRTFTSYTNKPWSYTKKPLSLWSKYINIMNIDTLNELACKLKINIASAFFWRHKLLSFFKECKNSKLYNNIGLHNRPINENRKGTKVPYIPSNRLSLTIAIDSHKNVCLGTHYKGISTKILHAFASKNFNRYARILDSSNRYIIAVRKVFNAKNIYTNCAVPNIHRYYYTFLSWIGKRFRGIATKNLIFYVGWFNDLNLA